MLISINIKNDLYYTVMTKNLIHACFKGWLLQHTAPYWGMIFRNFSSKWFPFVINLPNRKDIISKLINQGNINILIEEVWIFEGIFLDFILLHQCFMQWQMQWDWNVFVCFGWNFTTGMWAMKLHLCIKLPSICQKIKTTHSPWPFSALFD